MGEKKPKMQKTPKGYEIPVPKRKDFNTVLDAAAKPVKKKRSRIRRPMK